MRGQRLLAPVIGALVIATFAAEAAAQSRGTKAVRPASEGVVNINTATAAQLSLLPGIGPSRAEAIVEARQRRPFRTVQELQRVRGIGWSTIRQLRSYLTVSGETTLRRPVPGRPRSDR